MDLDIKNLNNIKIGTKLLITAQTKIIGDPWAAHEMINYEER